MAISADSVNPVVVQGDVIEKRYTYIGDGSATFKAGELIRVTSAGTIKVAATTSANAGAVHGMALKDVNTATTDVIPVLLFTDNTVLRMQVYNATPANAEPRDLDIGSSYELRRNSNQWSVATTTDNAVVTVVDREATPSYFDPDAQADVDYGFVRVKVIGSVLAGHSA